MDQDFTLDLAVLRLLKDRKKFERFSRGLPEGTVNETTKKLVKLFGDFFKETQADRITYDTFWPFIRTRNQAKWKDKDIKFWSATLKPIDIDNPIGYDDVVVRNLLATRLAVVALNAIEQYQAGEEIELEADLRAAVEDFEATLDRRVRIADVVLDWDEMISEDEHNIGLQWRLPCVAKHMRALREGDFGIVAMRPDRGKTSWLASEVSYMAPQLMDLYPDEFRPVLWLNNEGPGRRILGRIRQAALGMSSSEIKAIGSKEAQRRYIELLGGREDRIQVKDIHGYSHAEVEELIRKLNPGLVVFDMIDNIQFNGKTMNHGERTDQVLEAMYQWARSAGVRYGFVGLATSQISAEGEGLQYPLQTQLKDSRTGKQGACDFILTGGFDPNMPMTRFIGTTKNKIKLEGASGNPQCQVFFDQDRSRLKEPEEVSNGRD